MTMLSFNLVKFLSIPQISSNVISTIMEIVSHLNQSLLIVLMSLCRVS